MAALRPVLVPTIVLAVQFQLLLFQFANAQTLTAELCSARLPTKQQYMASLYDGDDTIYLFGGSTGTAVYDLVLKYSIGLDTIEILGQLPFPDAGGGAVMNKFGDMFYLQGLHATRNGIYQYFPDNHTFAYVSRFDHDKYRYITLPAGLDTALIVGSGEYGDQAIVSLDLNTLESETIANFGSLIPGNPEGAVFVEQQDSLYIFEWSPILKYTRATNQFQLLDHDVKLPRNCQATWDGRFAYLFGEGERLQYSVAQFNPETGTLKQLQFERPPPLTKGVSIVYVGKLNRIYLLGGYDIAGSDSYRDTIYKINLDPLTEPKAQGQ